MFIENVRLSCVKCLPNLGGIKTQENRAHYSMFLYIPIECIDREVHIDKLG